MCRELIKVCRNMPRPATAPSTILFLGTLIRIRRPSSRRTSSYEVHSRGSIREPFRAGHQPWAVAQLKTQPKYQLSALAEKEVCNMSSYLTLAAMLLMVISPVLLPLFLDAVHLLANLLSNDQRPIANARSRSLAMAAAD